MPSESELHEQIYRRSADLAALFPRVALGPGDDCAVVRSAGSNPQQLLVTVDQMVEGRHFTRDTPIDLVARKAVARSISDIAAMAGSPAWSLATALIPRGYSHADQLFDACHRWARHFGAPLVGGDVAFADPGTPLVLTVTVAGDPAPARGPVTRSGARAGDDVYITGRIGGSLASGRHLNFEPRLAEARFLAGTLLADLHAMIDLSDGLGRDAARVAAASGVRIELDADLIPLHPEQTDVVTALADGEDYELLFTTTPGLLHRVRPPANLAPFIRVGRVVAGTGCVLLQTGRPPLDVSQLGWDHR